MYVRFKITRPDGQTLDIGPEHPDYWRLVAERRAANPPNLLHTRLLGLGCLALAFAVHWYQGRMVGTQQSYYPALLGLVAVVAPVGLLLVLFPRQAVTPQPDRSQAVQVLWGVLMLAAVVGFGLLEALSIGAL